MGASSLCLVSRAPLVRYRRSLCHRPTATAVGTLAACLMPMQSAFAAALPTFARQHVEETKQSYDELIENPIFHLPTGRFILQSYLSPRPSVP